MAGSRREGMGLLLTPGISNISPIMIGPEEEAREELPVR